MGVELRASVFSQLFKSRIEAQSLSVRPVGRHSVERIRHRDNTGGDIYLVSFESVRITPAVVFFVVLLYAGYNVLKLLNNG